jgi:hypothetical protein
MVPLGTWCINIELYYFILFLPILFIDFQTVSNFSIHWHTLSMRTRFYHTLTRATQTTLGVKCKINCLKLSADARAALLARQQQASQNCKNALGETWTTIDKLTQELATSHHKSVQRVQSKLHTGHELARKEWKKLVFGTHSLGKNHRIRKMVC